MKSHTKKWKEAQVAPLAQEIKQYSVIGVADLDKYPSNLLQQLKVKLSGKAKIKISKGSVIERALKQAGKYEDIKGHLSGSKVLVLTNMDPFELYSLLKKYRGKVSAKVGELASEDIIIPAGDTGLPPGPALSDLKAAGLNVRVQGATISVVADKVVTKKGEAVSAPVAGTLNKLKIKPMKLQLNLQAALSGKEVFLKDVLNVDAEEMMNKFVKAYQSALNLAVNSGFPTKQSLELMIMKAQLNAKALSGVVKLEGEVKAEEPSASPSAQ
jgi:large subunit ribosomal protein L10